MARSKKKGNIVTLNMRGVETRVNVEPGEYDAKVVEVTQEEGDKGTYLAWKFEITDGDAEGAPLYYNTSLTKQSLWNLKGLLETLDVDIPDDEFDIDLDELVDGELRLIVDEEEYNGKMKARVVDFEPIGKKGKKKPKDDDSDKKPKKKSKGDDDEDEGDKKSKKDKKAKKLDKLTQDEVGDMDQDELEEVNEKYELEVDFKKLKKLRDMKSAVIDALEENDYLDND